MRIDLNSDIGEGMDDERLVPLVTSVNIACGGHAGEASDMERAVAVAARHGLRIGAHPSYPDRAGFGRTALEMDASELEEALTRQLATLDRITRAQGAKLCHLKPHGALYHRAGESRDVAWAIAEAARKIGPDLVVVGQAGSLLLKVAQEHGLPVAAEAFADRRYHADGRLVPRTRGDALITDADEAAAQAVDIARDHHVVSTDGTPVEVRADTLCVHGDTPGAVAIVARIRQRLQEAGVEVKPFPTPGGRGTG